MLTKSVIRSKVFTSYLLIMLLFVLPGIKVYSQESKNDSRVYDIVHRGDVKGQLSVRSEYEGNILRVKMKSDVLMRIVIPFRIKLTEEATFDKGKLTHSHIRREVNGKEKINQQLFFQSNKYTVTGTRSTPVIPTQYTSYHLYVTEPINTSLIYSDAFKKNVPIARVSEGKYRVDLPDGSYTFYNYKKGICTLVQVEHSLVTIFFRLQEHSSSGL